MVVVAVVVAVVVVESIQTLKKQQKAKKILKFLLKKKRRKENVKSVVKEMPRARFYLIILASTQGSTLSSTFCWVGRTDAPFLLPLLLLYCLPQPTESNHIDYAFITRNKKLDRMMMLL